MVLSLIRYLQQWYPRRLRASSRYSLFAWPTQNLPRSSPRCSLPLPEETIMRERHFGEGTSATMHIYISTELYTWPQFSGEICPPWPGNKFCRQRKYLFSVQINFNHTKKWISVFDPFYFWSQGCRGYLMKVWTLFSQLMSMHTQFALHFEWASLRHF